ncbi:MAG: hypothetical protein KBF17_03780 [Candidatus Promineofilum sp.]|nr:hypothetical protein [Promineifilum sp.]MBP9657285.1 hypothetical protein [Promineifilum sp.]
MTTVQTVHGALSNTAWLFFLIIGLWGLVRGARGQAVNGSYLGAAFIGQMIFVVQAILGTLLWVGGMSAGIQRPGIHLLYGVFALVFLPFIYLSVLRGDDTNRAQWVLAFTTLFLFGIALRAVSTAA